MTGGGGLRGFCASDMQYLFVDRVATAANQTLESGGRCYQRTLMRPEGHSGNALAQL